MLQEKLAPVAILAGGLATRMGDVAARTPKALLSVSGAPFIDHQLRMLSAQGIREVVLCTGHLGEQIEQHVGNGKQFGLTVQYSADGETRLGTGGAIKKAVPLLGPQFFVLYGDSYLDISFRAVFALLKRSPGVGGVMSVYANRNRWVQSNVLCRHQRIVAYNKQNPTAEMEHIDYGLSLFEAEVFHDFPDSAPFDLGAVVSELIEKGRLAGYEAKNRFYEIGTPEGLEETSAFIKLQNERVNL